VSEKLLDVYAEDAMSLDQLMAFTVTTDHARRRAARIAASTDASP
jgi:ParB family chromosome partitioning protein